LNELFGQAIPLLFASIAEDDFIGLAYRGHFPNPLIERCVRAIERKYQIGFIGCVHCFLVSRCFVALFHLNFAVIPETLEANVLNGSRELD
jgi:hypothetical protein